MNLLTSTLSGNTWQPIETAPLDRFILVFGFQLAMPRQYVAWHGPTVGDWYLQLPGWYEVWSVTRAIENHILQLTHWHEVPICPGEVSLDRWPDPAKAVAAEKAYEELKSSRSGVAK